MIGPGRYREDCSEYLLSSLAIGNTSELQGQVQMAASAHPVLCQ
jgi:hypothetical protein